MNIAIIRKPDPPKPLPIAAPEGGGEESHNLSATLHYFLGSVVPHGLTIAFDSAAPGGRLYGRFNTAGLRALRDGLGQIVRDAEARDAAERR